MQAWGKLRSLPTEGINSFMENRQSTQGTSIDERKFSENYKGSVASTTGRERQKKLSTRMECFGSPV